MLIEDEVYYTLGFAQRFDVFHRNAYEASGDGKCGTPYQRSGLGVSFSQQDLQRIPYNTLIEVPITVTQGQLCSKYNSIEVQIIATCEIPNSESQVFQYGIVNGAISYDDANKIYALNDTATFSVAWPDSSSRKLTEENTVNINSSMLAVLMDEKHDNLVASLKADQFSFSTSLKDDIKQEVLTTSIKFQDSLTVSLNDKFDSIMRIVIAAAAFIGIFFTITLFLLYRHLVNEKGRSLGKTDEYPQFRMP